MSSLSPQLITEIIIADLHYIVNPYNIKIHPDYPDYPDYPDTQIVALSLRYAKFISYDKDRGKKA
jgi:hypothetical protein